MSNKNDESTDEMFEYTGKGCVVPKDVTIVQFHPSVTEVEIDAFKECRELRKVELNDGLQKIGKYAFYNCKSLLGINLPSTVTEIGTYAFSGCNNLTEVVLNEGLQKIGWYAFWFCTALSTIKLPSTVTEIGNYAFYACINLREVVFHGVPRKIIGRDAFGHSTTALHWKDLHSQPFQLVQILLFRLAIGQKSRMK